MRPKSFWKLGTLGLGIAVAVASFAFAGRGGGMSANPGNHSQSGVGPNDPSLTSDMGMQAQPSPTAAPLSAADGKKLLGEFLRAQTTELKALDHRNKLELKELKASQAARQKDWERRERDARHKYFADHTTGPERRAYITDFMARHKDLLRQLSDERTQRLHDQDVRLQSTRSDQTDRLKEFKDAIDHGQVPAKKLWPEGS